ncbi:MAG: bifunctional 5,10-methylenetetrahydrofolate dehydrogenase/5,10-methenyltetrahydrofolate cyclohydrolase, partial [Flavobacteriales bacterium]
MVLLDGKATSTAIKEEIAIEVAARKAKGLKTPHLAAILIGDDGASQTYVGSKVKSCEKVGFKSTLVQRDGSTSEAELLEIVDQLNADPDIDGFIVQLPLPKHIDEHKVLLAIDPEKDVDGFHPENVGKMVLSLPTYLPATPFGIMQLLERYEVPTQGKHCVVIGRSHIVGSPMSILLSQNANPGNCTVTITHSRTKDLEKITRTADILVVALGKAEFVTADMVKEGATVIDVGITRIKDDSKKKGYRIAGDVH